MWDTIKEENDRILQVISEYNSRIKIGNHVFSDNLLDPIFFNNLVAAQMINILLNDSTLYITSEFISNFDSCNNELFNLFEWDFFDNNRSLKQLERNKSSDAKDKLIQLCFNDKNISFIDEICAHDILYSGTLAKDISSFLRSIVSTLELNIKSIDVIMQELSEARKTGIFKNRTTEIQEKFQIEYSKRYSTLSNRIFYHNSFNNIFPNKIDIPKTSYEMLNYKFDKNYCQLALLHIEAEGQETGTGFLITEDGYALTCEHVVGDAKQIYATQINGCGYPNNTYDVGWGEVIYTNKELDIALVKMENYSYGFLPIEQNNLLPDLGEEVVVFGYPLGYEMPQSNSFGPNISFYKGYVSSNQISNENSVTFLDIDVKSGNSGSPVISTRTGKVIGIISGIKLGGRFRLNEKMPYMIPIQHFNELNKSTEK